MQSIKQIFLIKAFTYISILLYTNAGMGGSYVNADTKLNVQEVSKIMKLLGDKTRLTMMKMLQSQDFCVCEFVELFNMSQPAISQHLRKLKDIGLVKESRKRQWIFYSFNRNHDCAFLVEDLLKHLPDQRERLAELEAQGLRISCD